MDEAVAGQNVMHDDIVLVGVYSDASALCKGPVEKGFCRFMTGLNGCNTVNYMIRDIIEPITFDV
jgi:hypothetical protein